MAELRVMGALREKRSELSGAVSRLEQQLAQHRGSLAHLDATMRLFDPDLVSQDTDLAPQRERVSWFRPGECRRLIYDLLRDAPQPLATRDLAARVMAAKNIPAVDDHRSRALIQKTVLASLPRAKATIERTETAGVMRLAGVDGSLRRGAPSWQAACRGMPQRPGPLRREPGCSVAEACVQHCGISLKHAVGVGGRPVLSGRPPWADLLSGVAFADGAVPGSVVLGQVDALPLQGALHCPHSRLAEVVPALVDFGNVKGAKSASVASCS